MISQPTDDSVPQGADRGTSPGGRSSPQLTRQDALRKRRPYRPRRDRGRFRLTPRDEWGMRYIADMWALRIDQLLDMFALWHYQEEMKRYEQRLADYQLRPQGPQPELPTIQPQTKSKVLSIINRWLKHGYAVTDQPHDADPIWLTLSAKAMRELKLPYEAGFPPKEDLKESGHIFACNQVRFKLMKTKTYGKYVWWSERAIKANWEEGAPGVAYDQLPDAVLYLDGVAQVCVEVELTRKTDDRYDQTLTRLTALYPEVLYCVRGERLYHVLMDARARLGQAQQQVQITLL
jgi:hypothetical protein